MTFFAAFSRSALLTKGVRITLLGFFAISYLVMFIPLVGILFGVPLCKLAGTYIYRQLEKQTKE
jgi:hypothetical protein